MAKKILYFENFAQAFESVKLFVGEGLGKKYFVITPDKYTLRLEQTLFYDRGSFCVQVTSFSRLYYQICDFLTAISHEGGVMVLKNVLSKLTLKYYNRSKNFNGFAAKMYETIKELMDAGITPDDLKGKKLQDIALIYREYLNVIQDKYVDTSGKKMALAQKAEFFRDSEVIVVGFNGYTNSEKELIDEIAKHCDLTILERKETFEQVTNPVIIYKAAGWVDSIKFTAKKIKNELINGALPKDIGVIAPQTANERIKRIFWEYDIPFHVDDKKKLSDYPSGSLFCALLDAKRSNFSAQSIITLAKNPYFGLTKKQADSLDIYLEACGQDRKYFFEKFKVEHETLPYAEEARQIVSALILQCEKLLCNENYKTGVEKIVDLLKMRRFGNGVSASNLYGTNAYEHIVFDKEDTYNLSQLDLSDVILEPESNIDKILELADIIDKIQIEDSQENTDYRLEILTEGIVSSNILRIPEFSGSIMVGEPSVFRGQRKKFLFVLGCNEGQIPLFNGNGGILCDKDIDKLNKKGYSLAFRQEQNDKEEREVLELISLSQDVTVIYDGTGETKVSDFVMRLNAKNTAIYSSNNQKLHNSKEKVESKEIFEKNLDKAEQFLDKSEQNASKIEQFAQKFDELNNQILYDCCAKSSALERLITNVSAFRAGAEFVEQDGAIFFALQGEAKNFVGEKKEFNCVNNGKNMLAHSTYISQLQTFFECPAKHFFRYGLKLKRRETSALNVLDVGNFMHRIVEIVIGSGNFDDIAGEVEKAAAIAIDEGIKYSFENNTNTINKIKEESKQVISIFVSHLKKGSFGNIKTETSFGENSKLQGIMINSNPPLALKGKIDMMDFCANSVRIIDYKTGNAKFSLAEIYCGKKLQLPLYMAAAEQNGYKGVGMFFFPLKSSWKDDEFSHRLSGVYTDELDTMLIMDKTLGDGTKSEVIDAKTKLKDGKIEYKKTVSAISDEQFKDIIDYSKRLAASGVKKIREGYCTPSPLKNRFASCSMCEFNYCCPGGTMRTVGKVTIDSFKNIDDQNS